MLKIIVFSVLVAITIVFPFDERIVNGTNANLGEIPYIISLRVDEQHNCGGSIINPTWVLTAAHCVHERETKNFSVQYGVVTISRDDQNSIKVIKIIKHEKYNPDLIINDVAVLKLESPIPFSFNAQPVKLPHQSYPTPAKAKALVSGWGRPYTGGDIMIHLQKVEIQVYSDDDCERIHATSGPAPTNRTYHLCAGVPEGGKGQCNGDSGGPLSANGVQVGIVSWSIKPCTLKGYPGVYVKVSSYIDWINDKIENN